MWLYTYYKKDCKLYKFILKTKDTPNTMIWYELGKIGVVSRLNNYKKSIPEWLERQDEWIITKLEDNDIFFLENL